MIAPRRGSIWTTDSQVTILVISSTVYNEIASEPTVVVVPVFDQEPGTGFGVTLGGGWAIPGLLASLRKSRLREQQRQLDVDVLTQVNTMLFKILATPER